MAVFNAGDDADHRNLVKTAIAIGDDASALLHFLDGDFFALGEAGGAITLGDISAGPSAPPAGDFSVGFASATSISVGNVSGADRVGFATLGDLATGNLSAGNLIMTLVGGDIAGGAMTLRQLLFRPTIRLDPYKTPANGLYICSSATPPGGGVHGMCGHLAAQAALRGQ